MQFVRPILLNLRYITVPDQIGTLSQVGTNARSFNLAQKVLTWSNWITVDAILRFMFYCLFFALYMYSVRIYFSCERCDICVDFYMIYNYMLRMAFLIEFAGGFIVFLFSLVSIWLLTIWSLGSFRSQDTYDRCDCHDRCDGCAMVSIWSLGSLRSLQSLRWWFPLTFYDRSRFYPSDRDRCDRWQSLGSLAIAGKMKIWFPYDRYDRWTLY